MNNSSNDSITQSENNMDQNITETSKDEVLKNESNLSSEQMVEIASKIVKKERWKGRFVSFLLFVLLVGTAGFVAYEHFENRAFQENQKNTQLKFDAQSIENKVTDLSKNFEQYRTNIAQKDSLIENNKNGVAKLVNSTSVLEKELNQVKARFDISKSKLELAKLSEAKILVRLADKKVKIDKDFKAAADLLKEVDAVIKDVNDNRSFSVREVLAKEINLLSNIQEIDVEGGALRIENLVDNIDVIPVKISLEKKTLADVEISNDISDWKENLKKSGKEFLNSFIIVKNRTYNDEMLLPVEHIKYLRENIKLNLNLAALAYYHSDFALFEKEKALVLKYVEQYFEASDSVVQNIINTLNEIEVPNKNVETPKALESVRTVENYVQVLMQEWSKK